MRRIIDRFKNRVQNFKINFKKKFKESKEKPKSKRKSFILGLATPLAIFGFTFFGPALSAVAKDLTQENPKPTYIVPAPPVPPTVPSNEEIFKPGLPGGVYGLLNLAASVYSLAITTGSFAVGVVCGCIVVIGILNLKKKK